MKSEDVLDALAEKLNSDLDLLAGNNVFRIWFDETINEIKIETIKHEDLYKESLEDDS
jgi:hypothetical protein